MDMFMNYMDYVNDDAMFMFTKGQKDKMLATLTVNRASLIQINSTTNLKNVCAVQEVTVKTVQATTATLNWDFITGVKYYTLAYKKQAENEWKTITTTSPSFILGNLEVETTYECQVKSDCDNASFSKTGTFTTKSRTSSTGFAAEAVRSYPNPVRDIATLTLDGDTFAGKKVTILDAAGQVKFEKTYTTAVPTVQLDMSEMGSGMYMIIVQKDNNRVVKKVMKVRE
jgi:hypothetical protein